MLLRGVMVCAYRDRDYLPSNAYPRSWVWVYLIERYNAVNWLERQRSPTTTTSRVRCVSILRERSICLLTIEICNRLMVDSFKYLQIQLNPSITLNWARLTIINSHVSSQERKVNKSWIIANASSTHDINVYKIIWLLALDDFSHFVKSINNY